MTSGYTSCRSVGMLAKATKPGLPRQCLLLPRRAAEVSARAVGSPAADVQNLGILRPQFSIAQT